MVTWTTTGGDAFPDGPVKGIKEGDTPSFLYLIPNGLNTPEHPEWGGWGGRFIRSGAPQHYTDAEDLSIDREHGDWATVYRWRPDFQADFQARMDWCIQPPSATNHPPHVKLHGDSLRQVRAGETVSLDGTGSLDPDGTGLVYEWRIYRDAGTCTADVTIDDDTQPTAELTLPEDAGPGTLHVILKVTDHGTPPLSRYGRIVIEVQL